MSLTREAILEMAQKKLLADLNFHKCLDAAVAKGLLDTQDRYLLDGIFRATARVNVACRATLMEEKQPEPAPQRSAEIISLSSARRQA